ncbi:MAG: VWA domain-containing protein [Gammaproteobacteria bacterium]|nr:VWA domain-containing protein [Gammaproteobacteria bacterium]MCP5201472.1 VWA domain-containing protein [Gammaproteobacteria bacterium]
MLDLEHPAALLLLPLALVPLIVHGQSTVVHAAVDLLPEDGLSRAIDAGLRLLGALAVAAMVLGIGGLYRAEQRVERIGQGAQDVLLIDSSGSMDSLFAVGNDQRGRAAVWGTYTSKGQVARRLLAEYAARRPQDTFALFLFSGNPIPVLPLTAKQDLVQAAIAAGAIERGLASTDLANGLIRSLQFFEGKPFTGSRIVMLVSDGAAHLTVPQQDRIKYLLEKYRVSLYWLYLRTQFSPGLFADVDAGTAEQVVPEQAVHAFFSGMGLPYRAFSAENPAALKEAIAEVDALQNLPMRYEDVIPRRDLSAWCYGAGLALLLVLLGARTCEVQRW